MTLTVVSVPVQTFSIQSAADACGVSIRTIHRRMPVLREHGAAKDAEGQWSIPWAALAAAELHPGKPRGADPVASHTMTGMPSDDMATLVAELAAERTARAEERAARNLAEQLLAAEQRVNAALQVTVDVLRHQLERGSSTTDTDVDPEQDQQPAPATAGPATVPTAHHTEAPEIAVESSEVQTTPDAHPDDVGIPAVQPPGRVRRAWSAFIGR